MAGAGSGPGACPGGTDPAPAGGGVSPAVYLAFVIFAWGGNYTWIKLALEDGGALVFNALRYATAVALLGGALLLWLGPRRVLPVPGERIPLALIGLLQAGVMTAGTTLAMEMIEASRTVLIAYSMPIWGMLLSFLILGERPTVAMLAGLVLGLAGLALLSAPWEMDWTSRPGLVGSALALGGTLGWALGSVLYRRRVWRSGFWAQVMGQLAPSAVLIALLALTIEARPTEPTPRYLAIVLYNGVVPTILAFWCWARALTMVPVATASQILLLSPVFGVLLSALVLGERISPTLIGAMALIVAGAGLSYMRRRPGPAPGGAGG